MRLRSFLFATAAQQFAINAGALKVCGRTEAKESKNLLAPMTEQEFQFDNIDAFEYAM